MAESDLNSNALCNLMATLQDSKSLSEAQLLTFIPLRIVAFIWGLIIITRDSWNNNQLLLELIASLKDNSPSPPAEFQNPMNTPCWILWNLISIKVIGRVPRTNNYASWGFVLSHKNSKWLEEFQDPLIKISSIN